MKILSLFPIPIYQSRYDNYIDLENLLHEVSFTPNTGGNYYSREKNILEGEKFKELKASILEHVSNYFSQIVKPKFEIVPYINASWINLSKIDTSHHRHSHSNSFCSGVIYLQADQNLDNITFYSNRYQQIKIYTEEYNEFNSDTWTIPVNTGDILIFPSHLDHSVSKIKSDLRISLSFNIFVKGMLGNNLSNNLIL
jgi:uncharacterized protein (TIGR02466 family)